MNAVQKQAREKLDERERQHKKMRLEKTDTAIFNRLQDEGKARIEAELERIRQVLPTPSSGIRTTLTLYRVFP